jgi:hypothetical protein
MAMVLRNPPAGSIEWEYSTDGISCTLRWIVENENPAEIAQYVYHAPFIAMLQHGEIPSMPVSKIDSEMVCIGVNSTQFLNSMDKFNVVARYVNRGFRRISLTGNVTHTMTRIDRDGKLITVDQPYGADGTNGTTGVPCIGEVPVMRPGAVLNIEVVTNISMQDFTSYIGTINSSDFWGQKPYTWLCTNIGLRGFSYKGSHGEMSSTWYPVNYTFEWQGYELGKTGQSRNDYRPFVFWRDYWTKQESKLSATEAQVKIIQSGDSVGNGWKRVNVYRESDFTKLPGLDGLGK